MRNNLAVQLNNLSTVIIFAIVIVTPLLFSPFFTEFYETSKLAFLVTAMLVLLLTWTLSWVIRGRVVITRTPLDLPLLLFLLVIVISAIFSQTQSVAIYGNIPKIHGSAVSLVTYGLFYLIAVSHLKSTGQLKSLFYGLLLSSTVVAIVTLLAYFSIYLPLSIVSFQNFSPAGSSFATSAILILTLPMCLLSITRSNNFLPKGVALILATLFTLTIGLIGASSDQGSGLVFSASFIGLMVAYLVTFIALKGDKFKNKILFMMPAIVFIAVLVTSHLPIGGTANFLHSRAVSFPREVQLPFDISWKVAASAFRDAPFFGTGPGTFVYNFSLYKPVSINNTDLWNLRFDSAYNEYLQVLGTVGGLGLLALVFLSAVILNFGYRGLRSEDIFGKGLAISAILVVVLLAIHTTSVVTMLASLVILAMLMVNHKSANGHVEELSIGIKASKALDNNLVVGDILPIIVFFPVALFVIWAIWPTFWFTGNNTNMVPNVISVLTADYNHRAALNAASTRGLDTYNHLVQAENMNSSVDLYRTDLAQTNFALANAIAAQKGPTESSPGGSLTDQDKTNIRTLLSQAIQEGQTATVLNPRNPTNFEVLAGIYRQISGVAENASNFALNAYGEAIKLDPLNPVLRLNVGGVYYSLKNYDMAIRFFSDAVNLKPDLANAYYNLSIALREKGDLKSAVQIAQQVVVLLQKDTNNPDYKLASDYLKNLQAVVASGSADPNVAGASSDTSSYTPPAAANSSPLQQKNYPKILDLPKTSANVATPPAVKK